MPLFLGLVGVAAATPLTAVDCATGAVVTAAAASSSLCASGTTEANCAARVYLLEAGEPGLVDVRAAGATAVTGSFDRVLLAEPPLITGGFDLVLDEDCDGARGAGDIEAPLAVSIPAEPIALAEDPAAFRADWQGRAEAWADVAVHWRLHQGSPLLGDTAAPVWLRPGGNPALMLLWTADGLTGVAVDPSAAHLLSAGGALGATLDLTAAALSADPADATLDPTAAQALGYPFSAPVEDQDIRSRTYVAGALAEVSVLLAGLHGSLVALDGAEGNTEAARAAQESLTRTRVLLGLFDDLTRVSSQLVNGTTAIPATGSPWSPELLQALQERVASEGWDAAEQDLLDLHGLDADAVAAELLATVVPARGQSYRDTLTELRDALVEAEGTLADLEVSLEAIAAAHATWAIPHDPVVSLDGPYFARVGQTVALTPTVEAPRGAGAVQLSWDLDADGVAGDVEGDAASWSPVAPARSLLRLDATDDRGVTVSAFATLESELEMPRNTWVETAPETTFAVRQADATVSFLALASAGTGLPLTYTFSLDGVVQTTVEPATAEEPAYWDWQPDASAVGLHHVEVLAQDPAGARADQTAHWAIQITEASGGDGGGDGGSDGGSGSGSGSGSGDGGDPEDTGIGAGPPTATEGCGGCDGGDGAAALPLLLLGLGLGRRRRSGPMDGPPADAAAPEGG